MNEIFSLIILFTSLNLLGQETIPITEATIKLGFSETSEVFYSFAEGDEIVFNFNVIRGKHIKEVEIIKMPNNSIFLEFKAKHIKDKRIQIRNKGIYKFRFHNSAIANRICKYTIERIPASGVTRNFNTNWKWQTLRDTVYTPYQKDSLIGFKTINYTETVKELKNKKLEEIMLFEKTETIHSYYNENSSKSYLKVDLPITYNTYLHEENIVAWSYWIGVGQESREAYKKNLSSFANAAGKIANAYYQNPLAGIALGEISDLIIPQTGEDVQYYLIPDYQNLQLFYNNQSFMQFDNGKGSVAYGRNDRLKEGTFYIGLYNDNKLRGIEVDVKVLVVKEVKIYENVVYNRKREKPQYIKLNKTRRDIVETKIRVPVE